MKFASKIHAPLVIRVAAWGAGTGAVALAWALTRDRPSWVVMLAVAATEWLALKLASLTGFASKAEWRRVVGYLVAWPGMNARAFFATPRAPRPPLHEAVWAVGKMFLGFMLTAWALRHARDERELLVAWVAVIGVLFVLHFGGFHVGSVVWRTAGVDAPPIMRAPMAATSLSELWGARWNLAVAPLPLLFHAPFAHNVIVPLCREAAAFLP